MLKVFENLLNELSATKVPYCSWKGHHSQGSALNGHGDLDLFVPIVCNGDFLDIIERHGFRRVVSYQARHEFIEHYFALDKATNKFSHLHVYFKIVTGEHATKNYVLPLDNYLLRNIDDSGLLPAVNHIARRNVFLIRHFLKVGSIYGLLQYWRELNKYSEEWASFDHSLHHEGVPELDLTGEELYKLQTAYECASIVKQLFVSVRFKKRNQRFRKRGFVAHRKYAAANLVIRLANKVLFRNKKLLSPGIVIAVCGLDGSGKSSMVAGLREKFSKHFCVKLLHLGRPPPTAYSVIFRPLISIYTAVKANRVSDQRGGTAKQSRNISIIYLIRSVLLAHERRAAAERAHKYSRNGNLVLCDRYPGLVNGKMDCPRIPFDKSRGSVYQLCYGIEKKLYESIKPASNVFHLSVSLEVAIERNKNREKKGKETDVELEARFALNSDAEFLADIYNYVDASDSFDVVFRQLCADIWFSPAWKKNDRFEEV